MGCSGGADNDKILKYEKRLFAVCQKFNFDITENQRLTFLEKFCRENVNELGQNFNEQSGLVLILEFRKFLYLAAAEIARIRRSKQGYQPLKPIAYNDGKQFVGYESPLNASPYVDRVW